MFIMIIASVFCHQITFRLMLKTEKHPLRLVAVRVLEILGKTFVIPFVIFYFLLTFGQYGTEASRGFLFTVVVIISVYLFVREMKGLHYCYEEAIRLVRVKVDNPATFNPTTLELLAFNIYMFGIFSKSASHYHKWKREYDSQFDNKSQQSGRKASRDSFASGPRLNMDDIESNMDSIKEFRKEVFNYLVVGPVQQMGKPHSGIFASEDNGYRFCYLPYVVHEHK